MRDEGDRHRFPRRERQFLVHLRIMPGFGSPYGGRPLDLRVMEAEGGPRPPPETPVLQSATILPVDEPFLRSGYSPRITEVGKQPGRRQGVSSGSPLDGSRAGRRPPSRRGPGSCGRPRRPIVQRDAAEPEIGRQIDHWNAPGQERSRDRGRQGVRQARKATSNSADRSRSIFPKETPASFP